MARKKCIATKDKSSGYGFVGRWRDGSIGWAMPSFVNGQKRETEYPNDMNFVGDDDPLYLCRITVEVVKDKNGRPIIRRNRRPE